MSSSTTWVVGAIPPGMSPIDLKRINRGKSPGDITPITCDFTGALAAIDCDKLNVNVNPQTAVIRNDGQGADLYVVGTPSMNEGHTRLSVWLAAGSVGFEYLVTVTVQSSDGQTIARSFIMPVVLR